MEKEKREGRKGQEKGKGVGRGTSIYTLCQLVEYYVSGEAFLSCATLYHIHCPQSTYSKSHEGKWVSSIP